MTTDHFSPLNPSKIALHDMDGTLVDFDGQMQRDLLALASPGEQPYIYSIDDTDGPPWIEARKKLIKAQVGWWLNLPRFQLGWDVLEMCTLIGFSNNLLTKGPYTTTAAWTEKAQWARVNLPHTPITITEDKSLTYGRVLNDDWPPYIEPWLARRPRGTVIMCAQPWNANFRHERVIRYDGTNKAQVFEALKRSFDR